MKYRISFVLKIFATVLFLSVVWVYDPELSVSKTALQWYWISQAGFIYAVLLLIATFMHPGAKKHFPEYYYIIIWTLLLLATVEAIWGLVQFGLSKEVSGSFPTTRLYAGYLAVIFPIALNEWLGVMNKKQRTAWLKLKAYLLFVACVVIVIAVLFTKFYLAWFVLSVLALFVIWHRLGWKNKIIHALKYQKRGYYALGGFIATIVTIAVIAVLLAVNDKAVKEHYFLTKIAFRAVTAKPLTGHGPTRFAYAYGEAQEQYFADSIYLPGEEMLAGEPEYASNGYLHNTIEWGIPVMLSVLVFIGLSLYMGIKNKRISASAGMLGILLFSFFSYPMQIPAFIITFLFLIMACVMGNGRIWLVSLACIVGIFSLHWWETNDYDASKEWAKYRRLFYVESYTVASAGYKKLYEDLKDNPDFMYEYGYSLHKLKQYNASNAILQEAVLLSSEPEIYDMMGRNYQLKGEYEEAEKCYLKSAHMVPERISPFYLLAQLYNEFQYYDRERSKEMARKAIVKEQGNKSLIVQYMRVEAQKLLALD